MLQALSLLLLLVLANCALIPGAVVSAALSPVVIPVIDRALAFTHLDFIDPAGTAAVKDYDQDKSDKPTP